MSSTRCWWSATATACSVGTPLVAGAAVKATVLAHGRGDKVRIFKLRRRKHYQKTQGHRQNYTEIAHRPASSALIARPQARRQHHGTQESRRQLPKRPRFAVQAPRREDATAASWSPPASIIVRQRGTQVHPGENVGMGKDHTLYAKVAGKVQFGVKGPAARRR